MTDRELMKMANRIEALAFEMKAPNAYTPQFVMLANEIRMRARLAQPEEPDWSAAGFSKPPTHSEAWWKHEVSNAWAEGYEKGRASVKQPEQEPVWVEVTTNTGDKFILDSAVEADKIRAARDAGLLVVPLYTAPPQRDETPAKAVEWQGLTDEEIREFEIWLDDEEEKHGWNPPADIVKYIEAKLKDKNHAI